MEQVNRENILKAIQQNSKRIAEFGVHRIGLFGSFSKDLQGNKSDIDFLVEFQKAKKNIDNYMGLAFYLEDMFKRNIDLLTPEALSPHMKARILKEVQYIGL